VAVVFCRYRSSNFTFGSGHPY